MPSTPAFSDLLRLIDERSSAFRDAVAAATDLDAQVPTCPEWTLFDLATHIGTGRRSWAATVAAGPAATAKINWGGTPAAPRDRPALLDWLSASTQEMISALREAGPDRGCWTWWADSQSPENCGAVARHQLQEITMHTYDAQLTVGTTHQLPTEIAVDGVDEFLMTCVATAVAWPHAPAVIDYHVEEGGSWRLRLSASGIVITQLPSPAPTSDGADEEVVDLTVRTTAAELLLSMYGRITVDSLPLDGNRNVLDQLVEWDPSE